MLCQIDFENKRLLFENPVETLSLHNASEITYGFAKIEEWTSRGLYVAGFLSYEAGYSFEPKLSHKEKFDFPLLSFGAYREPMIEKRNPHPVFLKRKFQPFAFSQGEKESLIKNVSDPSTSGRGRRSTINSCPRLGEGFLGDNDFNISKEKYFDSIQKIFDEIVLGETYQITFCVKKNFSYTGDSIELYNKLLDFQPVPYPAYISTDDFKILSLSPEMFVKKSGSDILVKPMKGTLIRDGSLANNFIGKRWLHNDPKNRAENVMITDLLRNDLGKICTGGSVKTTKLFEVAKYKTVYQMTSTVEGKLEDKNIDFYSLFKAIFPSGSVTGAPKIRAMEIIRDVEVEERKIYTGAIGYITPQRDLFFNIPIRTILLQKDGDRGYTGEMGIGGGITHYSTKEGEYDECLVKGRFLDMASST